MRECQPSGDNVFVEFEGFLDCFGELVALDEELQVLAVALDQLADEACAGVLDGVVGEVQYLEAGVLYVYLAIGCFLDLKHEGHWLLRRPLLPLLVSLQDLVPRFLFQFMLVVLLLGERHLANAVEEQLQEFIAAQCVLGQPQELDGLVLLYELAELGSQFVGDVVAVEIEALEPAIRNLSNLLQDFLGDLVADPALAEDEMLQRGPHARKKHVSPFGVLQQRIPLKVKRSELLCITGLLHYLSRIFLTSSASCSRLLLEIFSDCSLQVEMRKPKSLRVARSSLWFRKIAYRSPQSLFLRAGNWLASVTRLLREGCAFRPIFSASTSQFSSRDLSSTISAFSQFAKVDKKASIRSRDSAGYCLYYQKRPGWKMGTISWLDRGYLFFIQLSSSSSYNYCDSRLPIGIFPDMSRFFVRFGHFYDLYYLSQKGGQVGHVYNNFMRASPGKQFSIGDIITSLINKRLTPLADRQQSWSQRRRSSLSNQRRIAKQHSLFNPNLEPIRNIKEKMGPFPQDFGDWLHSSKKSSSRLLQGKKTSEQERKRSRQNDNPEKYTSKDKLLTAFLARKRSSGQLQNLLEKTDTKEPSMFRETFRTLKSQDKSSAIKSSTTSQFYLTTMSKQTIPFSSALKSLHFSSRKRPSHLYRTFYA